MRAHSRAFPWQALALVIFLLGTTARLTASEPLPFRKALEMAVQRNAPAIHADEMLARAGYYEARNMYLPQVVVGSGLGKSFGYPMSIEGAAPAAFNVNYQSYLYNPAQKEIVRSAKQQWLASASSTRDQRDQILLEAATVYIQLDTLTARIRLLRQQQVEASKLEAVVAERVGAGVDSALELTKAKLSSARVLMQLVDGEGAADVLRERLAQLTGLPADSIETVPESIPEVPDISDERNLMAAAAATNPAVKAAERQAAAKELLAKGQHKAFYPAIDLVGSYGLFTKYNNYEDFFRKFQRNNATLGVAIRFPFLNFSQRAQAEAADAEAVQAKRKAENTRNQVSTETLKLGRAARQLAAAEQVAHLEYQVAQKQAEAIQARIEAAAPGTAQSPPPSPRDLQVARIQAGDRYLAYLDTGLELQKTRLELLRVTGRLLEWALPGK
jgi:outer membrane protein